MIFWRLTGEISTLCVQNYSYLVLEILAYILCRWPAFLVSSAYRCTAPSECLMQNRSPAHRTSLTLKSRLPLTRNFRLLLESSHCVLYARKKLNGRFLFCFVNPTVVCVFQNEIYSPTFTVHNLFPFTRRFSITHSLSVCRRCLLVGRSACSVRPCVGVFCRSWSAIVRYTCHSQ